MQKFDLFVLHSEKDRPKGWIWVELKSKKLKKEFLKSIQKTKQKEIAIQINSKLKAGLSTVEKHLIKLKYSNGTIGLPLPIVIELIKIINPRAKKEIIKNFRYFICKNNTTKQKTRAVKKIEKKLAKIVGAHMADGYMQKEGNTYKIKICDERRDSIEKCSEWIKEVFSINPRVRYGIRFNKKYWLCWFNNKIIGRYLENIFKIKAGKKFDIAQEPKIIKKSPLDIRKEFAKGIMMFDGGVKTSGMVSITSMSKQLIEDLYKILALDKISVNKGYNKKKGSWLIESKSGRDKDYLKKWLDYFEPATWKYERLKFFIRNKKHNIEELDYLFPIHHKSKISLKEVYNAIKFLKKGKIKDIMTKLNKNNLSYTTVYKYLYLLEKSGLIYKEIEHHITNKTSYRESIYCLTG